MKKKLIHLFQYKFTDHDYKNREYRELEKNCDINVSVHDLSRIFFPNLNYIKARSLKNSKKFKSIKSWIKSLNVLKKSKNVFIVNELGHDTFKSLIIHYYLKKSGLPILIDWNIGVVEDTDFKFNKLNLSNFFIKLKRILKNNYLLFYFLKKKFLNSLFLFLKFEKVIVLQSGSSYTHLPFRFESKKIVKVHSRDYSNYLINYNKKKKVTKKSKPIIFLDATFPYFKDDEELYYRRKKNIDLDQYYSEHNFFFDKLEDYFATKVIVTPHPKTRGVKNPYFKKRVVDYGNDATLKLTPDSLFVICGIYVSTAISFAISCYKPIFFLYSDQYNQHYEKQTKTAAETAKLIGSRLIDINNFKKSEILKNMKINKKLYNNYKYNYLTSKSLSKNPNYQIINKLILKN